MDPPIHVPESEAERLYCAHVERCEEGDREDLDALCARHPALERELRALAADHAAGVDLFDTALGVARVDFGRADLERYEVRGEIARGGMGVVLEVYDRRLRRVLALKRLLPRIGDEGRLARIRRARARSRLLHEAEVLAQLEHPAIVPVHEIGVDQDGDPYFTMLRVRGDELGTVFAAARAGRDGWSLPGAVDVIVQVCNAMAHAHQRGVYHRDLKPSNVMVGGFAATHVVDWGLSKVTGAPLHAATAAERVHLPAPPETGAARVVTTRTDPESASPALATLPGEALGTPAYMAPEQAGAGAAGAGAAGAGAAGAGADRIDARAEVYSVGAILYQLLAGHAPYHDAHARLPAAELLQVLAAGPPASLARVAPDAPPELMAICEKAMRREPAARYASMVELAADMSAWLAGHVVRAHRTGVLIEVRKWVRRNPVLASALGLALVSLAALVTVHASSSAAIARGNERLVATNAALRRADYFSRTSLASSAFAGGEIDEMRGALAGCPEDLRGWEWHCLHALSDTSVRTLSGHEHYVAAARFTPDGTHVLLGSYDGAWSAWERASGARVAGPLHARAAIEDMALEPAGATLFTVDRTGELMAWSWRTGALAGSVDAHAGRALGVAVARDGTSVATAGWDGRAVVWGWPGLERRLVLDHAGDPLDDVLLAPGGTRLFTAGTRDGVHAWSLPHGARAARFDWGGSTTLRIALDPAGRTLAASDGRVVRLLDADGLALRTTLPLDLQGSAGLAWTRDGRLAVCADRLIRLIAPPSAEPLLELVGHEQIAVDVEVAPDGRWLASSGWGRTTRLWDLDAPSARRVLQFGQVAAAIGNRDEWIAFRVPGERVEIWSRRERRLLRELRDVPGGQLGNMPGIDDFALSPTDTAFVLGGPDGIVTVRDGADGRVVRRLGEPSAPVRRLAFTPDGAALVVQHVDGRLERWDLATGASTWRARPAEHAHVLSLALDGARIVVLSGDATVHILDARSGATERELTLPGDHFRAVLHPDDRRLLLKSHRGLALIDLATGAEAWCSAAAPRYGEIAFTPDGTRIFHACRDGVVRVLDTETGQGVAALPGRRAFLRDLDVSADGRLVIACDQDGRAFLWEAAGWTAR